MFKKIVVAVLLFSVVAAGGAALAYNAAAKDVESISVQPDPLANEAVVGDVQQEQISNQAGDGTSNTFAQSTGGESWQAVGTIDEVDDYGFNFDPDNGDKVYIELGPPDYWQDQGVALEAGQRATVTGSINEGVIHAAQLTLADGQILQIRNELNQPLWSGGASRGRGQNGLQQGDGDRTSDPQAQVDEWVTIEGTLMSFQGGSMTMGTVDGELITFQTGQPRFFSGQGINFQVGDEIVVVGFYEGEQFTAGEITQVSTGARVMLRDPNGRPLWAGPGNSNGNGKGGGGNR
jgi:hypothetical protein